MLEIRRALDLIEPEQRPQLAAVVAAMIVTALVQAVGVVSVMPFIALVADPEIVHRTPWMTWAYELLGVDSTRKFLVIVGILVVLLLAATNGLAVVTRWMSLRFGWDTHRRLSRRLLGKYLREPYSFFLDRNTAELNKRLLGDLQWVVETVVHPWMYVLTKGITALIIALLLVLIDPVLALLSAGILGAAYFIIFFATKRKQVQLGHRRNDAQVERYRLGSEVLGGVKDVKALRCEDHFLSRFDRASQRYAGASTSFAMIGEVPRYALETAAFGSIIVAIIYLLETRDTLDQVLPIVAMYALAGYRLIPALQAVFSSLAAIRFAAPVLVTVHEDLYRDTPRDMVVHSASDVSTTPTHDPLAVNHEIRLERVTFRYANTVRAALNEIDLVIPVSHTVGLVGVTGSGKTTMVDLLLGLLEPTAGRILIDGIPLDARTMPLWKQKVGYVSQSIFLSDSTIAENIAFGLEDDQVDPARVEQAARAAHLHEFVEELPLGYKTVVGERGVRLSGGERQRIAIARALYRNPDVLVLDEATSALDGATEEIVMQAIRGLMGQKTIVLIAHRLSTVRDCDIIYMFGGGSVVAEGTFADLVSDNVEFRTMAHLGADMPAEHGQP